MYAINLGWFSVDQRKCVNEINVTVAGPGRPMHMHSAVRGNNFPPIRAIGVGDEERVAGSRPRANKGNMLAIRRKADCIAILDQLSCHTREWGRNFPRLEHTGAAPHSGIDDDASAIRWDVQAADARSGRDVKTGRRREIDRLATGDEL